MYSAAAAFFERAAVASIGRQSLPQTFYTQISMRVFCRKSIHNINAPLLYAIEPEPEIIYYLELRAAKFE